MKKLFAAALLLASEASTQGAAVAAASCDRACLNRMVDSYLAALVAHLFKVRGGKIHEIEAMGFTEAYESKTGWE